MGWREYGRRVRAWLHDYFRSNGGGLAIMSAFVLCRAVAFLTAPSPRVFGPAHPADMWAIPPVVWGALFGLIGLIGLGHMVVRRRWYGNMAFAIVATLLMVWGTLFLVTSLWAWLERGSAYFCVVGLAVWAMKRGARTEVKVTPRVREVARAIDTRC